MKSLLEGHMPKLKHCTLILLTSLVACEDDTTDTGELLVDGSASPLELRVYLAAEGSDPDTLGLDIPSQVVLQSASGLDVATARVSDVWVPMEWGEPDADPNREYVRVEVAIESAYIDTVQQVDLTMDIAGSDAEWCSPMWPDAVTPGVYYLHLQPSCDTKDPLTNTCTLAAGLSCDGYDGLCRRDLLKMTLWDGTTLGAGGVCHSQLAE